MSDEPVEYRQPTFVAPADAAELVLVRHGESARAVTGQPVPLLDGHSDPELAPEGHQQAERVAARLARVRFDAVYVTTLQRTVQTAAPLVRRLGMSPRVEAELREVHLGEWETGMLFRKMLADGHPLAVRMMVEERWDVLPGAEPATAFARRVRQAVERIAASHRNQRVVIFTHGGVIGQILSLATGASAFAFAQSDNASLSHVVVLPERWIVRGYNDTAHLDPAFALDPSGLG